MSKMLLIILAILVGGFLLIQIVPYGRNHTNPQVVSEPDWSSPEGQALAERACYDCHSNETNWPWYSRIAPVSWLVQRDVQEGRRSLNFSEWGSGGEGEEGGEMAEVINEGEMPPGFYLIMFPGARLNEAEKRMLAQELVTIGGSGSEHERENGERDEYEADEYEDDD